jgi:serine/threonine protein kinase
MQAVHDTCVIHRDIKPANIFMCPDNVVKVGSRRSSSKGVAVLHQQHTCQQLCMVG